ncbi:MAG: DUF2752 domain-containing protein [Thermodesulfobacteriota bacterium]|nr:DUF2752 domain-containing protein [Thermodesulfobacteriota bacterium]
MNLFQHIQFIPGSNSPGFVRNQTEILTPPWRDRKLFFASLLKNRRIALVLLCVAALQIVSILIGLPGWQCPIRSTLGIPCPGCGLSTAITLIIKGDWQSAIHTHAFAPVFLFAFVILFIVSILPENLHRKTVLQIAAIEKHTAFSAYVLWGIVIYWIFRLLAACW